MHCWPQLLTPKNSIRSIKDYLIPNMQNPSHEAKNTISRIRIQRRETMASCPSYRAGYAAHIELGPVNREVELVEARPRYVTYIHIKS